MAAVRLVPPPTTDPPPPDTDPEPITMDAAAQILDAIKGLSNEVKEVSAKVGTVTTSIAVQEAKQAQHTADIAAIERRLDDVEEDVNDNKLSIVRITAWAAGCAAAVSAFAWLVMRMAGR